MDTSQNTRRAFLKTNTALAALVLTNTWPATAANNEDTFRLQPDKNIIPAPKDAMQWPAFRQKLAEWRDRTRREIKYNGTLYHKPEFAWAASSYACCIVMVYDETFYDPRRGAYTVDAFLDRGQREFGGYDSLVLWQAYPRIGVDNRNQFDFYRDMPGGLEKLRRLVETIHNRGIKVYMDYNPWDTGTRREGKSDLDVLMEMVKAVEVDGIFLDTMHRGAAEFRAKLDQTRPGVILEGEGAVPLENIHDHHASWAQWFDDSEVPGILRHKWLERRHMQHQIKRWDCDHTSELHTAWMNGSGMMVWENVFGAWVGWSLRDRSILRTMLPIQRRYTALFNGDKWTPLIPTAQPNLYASLWEGDGLRLWTLINRSEKAVQGVLLNATHADRCCYFDLAAGQKLQPRKADGNVALEGYIGPRGIGCFLSATENNVGGDFSRFLARQAATNSRADFDASWGRPKTQLTAVAPTAREQQVPPNMVEVPAKTIDLAIDMRIRECGFWDSSPVVEGDFRGYDCNTTQTFQRHVVFHRFAMDATPVTNAQFADFLKASGYKPNYTHKFLAHWVDGRPPVGKDDHPVVYVDMDDARAYARWSGKRLPTEEEWQYAAQGADNRRYPWGDNMLSGRCNRGEGNDTTPVTAFPAGRSPFGCYDMCGNVWQWTESERTDGQTRFCIIRGGSFFTASGSNWYVNSGSCSARLATKFLMMWPGLDRCVTVGFRCVMDLAD